MRVLIAGSGRLGARVIEALENSDHEMVALVQNARGRTALGRALESSFARVLGGPTNAIYMAAQNRLPVVWIAGSTDADANRLRKFEPDVLLTCGFGIILKKPLLDLPKIAAVNCHSSLLPNHRGPAPYTAVILAGEKESGITFHVMDEGIDTGPILAQHSFVVEPDDDAIEVYKKSADLAGETVVELLDRIEKEGLHPVPQPPGDGSYEKKLSMEERILDWRRSAEYLHRKVRACYPFSVAYFRHRGRTIRVTRARFDPEPVDAQPGTVLKNKPFVEIATGHGTFTPLAPYHLAPYPFIWPAPWRRPRVGSMLELPELDEADASR